MLYVCILPISCCTSFYTAFFFFIPAVFLFLVEAEIQEQKKLLSLLYYLNDWYSIVEKLNYLQ